MSNIEIVDELMKFGDNCHRLARLLEDLMSKQFNQPPSTGDTIEHIQYLDINMYPLWPSIKLKNPQFDLNTKQCKVLQYQCGKGSILNNLECLSNSILSEQCDYLDNTIICRSATDLTDSYDILIINESLEFCEDPRSVIKSIMPHLKHNAKIWIKFRPYTSICGGFHQSIIDKAYAHLVLDLHSNQDIKMKAVRPLHTYENLIKSCGLQVLNRKVVSNSPDNFFISSSAIMSTIIRNTWKLIDIEEAIKILSTESVTYLLST